MTGRSARFTGVTHGAQRAVTARITACIVSSWIRISGFSGAPTPASHELIALPAKELGNFVRSLAHRIAKFPAAGVVTIKDRVKAIALSSVEDFRRDSDLFGEGARNPEAQSRFQAALNRGFQTRNAEMDLAGLLGELADD